MGISDQIKNAVTAVEAAGISTRDWWSTKAPLNPENTWMVKEFGVEVAPGGGIDDSNDTSLIRFHNNEAGRHIKGLTLEEKIATIHYDDGRADKKFPLRLDRFPSGEHKGELISSTTDVIVVSAEQRSGSLDIKIATPENGETTFGIPKHTQLFLEGDNWPNRVTIDVANAGKGTRIANNSSANINVVGTTEAQREALINTGDKDKMAALTLDNNRSGSIVVGDSHKPTIALDEIPHGQVNVPPAIPSTPPGQKGR